MSAMQIALFISVIFICFELGAIAFLSSELTRAESAYDELFDIITEIRMDN